MGRNIKPCQLLDRGTNDHDVQDVGFAGKGFDSLQGFFSELVACEEETDAIVGGFLLPWVVSFRGRYYSLGIEMQFAAGII